MLTNLALSVLEKLINHYLQLDPNTLVALKQQLDKNLALDINEAPGPLYITIVTTGVQLSSQPPAEITATIQGGLWSLFQLHHNAADKPIGKSKVSISGDIHFATALRKILSHMDIDWEEHLSHWVGDSIAHQTCTTAKRAKAQLDEAAHNFMDDLSAYLQHEKQLTPKQQQVADFSNQVDDLRDDVERLAIRINHLKQHINI